MNQLKIEYFVYVDSKADISNCLQSITIIRFAK